MAPTTTTSVKEVTAFCSFCGKTNSEVQRLVAGPGVYICSECVELASWVVEDASRAAPEDASRRRTAYQNSSAEDILATLPALVRSAERIENELTASVGRLRQRGTDWETIAAAAGMDVDAARRRFETVGRSAP